MLLLAEKPGLSKNKVGGGQMTMAIFSQDPPQDGLFMIIVCCLLLEIPGSDAEIKEAACFDLQSNISESRETEERRMPLIETTTSVSTYLPVHHPGQRLPAPDPARAGLVLKALLFAAHLARLKRIWYPPILTSYLPQMTAM
ncbi:hypothetical protein LZ30DRAFT_690117 [Colletotrichum cereale]|nr:hypothetical protein LZ30DRAFT_690117 [Colletotrichum cereale]